MLAKLPSTITSPLNTDYYYKVLTIVADLDMIYF
jgi:hypothetical protein